MQRRSFLLGLTAAFAAPAIVRAESLMQIAALRESVVPPKLLLPDHAGVLWEGRTRRGTWVQKNGRLDFMYVNPDGPAFRQTGSNHDFETASKVFDVLGVTPYEDFGLRA